MTPVPAQEARAPAPLLDFTSRVGVVTGGATGIGRATSLAFARQGATVVIGDVASRAEETVDLIIEAGGIGLFVPTDVTDAADCENLVEQNRRSSRTTRHRLQQRRDPAADKAATGAV